MNLIARSDDKRLEESFKRRAIDEDWAAELLDVLYDSLRAALPRISELEEEARQVCGALGEFYGRGQGTAVEKIRFMREDHATALQRIAELEGQLNEQIVVAGARKAVANNWEDLHAQLEAKLAAADAVIKRVQDVEGMAKMLLSSELPEYMYDKNLAWCVARAISAWLKEGVMATPPHPR